MGQPRVSSPTCSQSRTAASATAAASVQPVEVQQRPRVRLGQDRAPRDGEQVTALQDLDAACRGLAVGPGS